ncbi:hypothetical protein H8356DRAFT_1346662 [Neocallimastix lanati (nom. inval.)]|nr:hypothetical protein H8356DRAFT_1346662 [Neocallimastix sp. JGI-2020a]
MIAEANLTKSLMGNSISEEIKQKHYFKYNTAYEIYKIITILNELDDLKFDENKETMSTFIAHMNHLYIELENFGFKLYHKSKKSNTEEWNNILKNYGINSNNHSNIKTYTNVNYKEDVEIRKSTTGFQAGVPNCSTVYQYIKLLKLNITKTKQLIYNAKIQTDNLKTKYMDIRICRESSRVVEKIDYLFTITDEFNNYETILYNLGKYYKETSSKNFKILKLSSLNIKLPYKTLMSLENEIYKNLIELILFEGIMKITPINYKQDLDNCLKENAINQQVFEKSIQYSINRNKTKVGNFRIKDY